MPYHLIIIIIKFIFLDFREAWAGQDQICPKMGDWKNGKQNSVMKSEVVRFSDQNLQRDTLGNSFLA